METLLELPVEGLTLQGVDIEVDLPWVTLARLRYGIGTRIELTWNQNAESEDIALLRSAYVPQGAFLACVDIRHEGFTLPGSTVETFKAYWIVE